jgi:hypothetical protein
MAEWLVEYNPYLIRDHSGLSAEERELPCFRIFSEDNPERWIAQTNEDLPRDVQEEAALIMAAALTRALG